MNINKEMMKLIANGIIGGRESDDAVLEWFKNRVDYGPDYNLVPGKPKGDWDFYCEIKGNCSHDDFDIPLIESFSYLEYRINEDFGMLPLDFPAGNARTVKEFMDSVHADFISMLYECHN